MISLTTYFLVCRYFSGSWYGKNIVIFWVEERCPFRGGWGGWYFWGRALKRRVLARKTASDFWVQVSLSLWLSVKLCTMEWNSKEARQTPRVLRAERCSNVDKPQCEEHVEYPRHSAATFEVPYLSRKAELALEDKNETWKKQVDL